MKSTRWLLLLLGIEADRAGDLGHFLTIGDWRCRLLCQCGCEAGAFGPAAPVHLGYSGFRRSTR